MPPSSTLSLENTPALDYNTSTENITGAEAELTAFLDRAAVITDPDQCHSRSSNAWVPAKPHQKPAIVVQPKSTDDVSRILKICSTRRIPVTAYAGGTSLPGALVATRPGGLCVDFGLMKQILWIDPDNMNIAVQPGVGWRQLDDCLRAQDCFFPPDPSPDACVGGMIAMSCAGTNAYRYGTMKEWVVNLVVVLADGTVVRTRRRSRKSSAGYDLTRLLIGSEGTLGLVTEATLRMARAPKNVHVAVATFLDSHAAVRAGTALALEGHMFEALELLCERSIHAVNGSGLSSRSWLEQPTLFLKMAGPQSTVDDLIEAARNAAHKYGATTIEHTGDAEQVEVLWSARKVDGKATIMMRKDPSDIFIPSDAAVPVSRIADLIQFSYNKLDEAEMAGSLTAHLGDGNVHVKIICPKSREETGRAIIAAVERKAVEMDGTMTGEHGLGIKLRDGLVGELGQTSVDMMRRIKLALDPLCILNPDKVVSLEDA